LRDFFSGFCVVCVLGLFLIWVGGCVLLREEIVGINSDEVCLLCVSGVVLMCVFLRVWEVPDDLRAG